MGEPYQSAAIEGTTKAFLLEEKRSLFYKYENKSKFIQKLPFISSPLRGHTFSFNVWFSNRPKCRKVEKMRRRALKWALNKKLFTECLQP